MQITSYTLKKLPKARKLSEEDWPLLLQSVPVKKAQEVHFHYDIVKRTILQSYELIPEAYRQKFRHFKKHDKQTYVQLAQEILSRKRTNSEIR